MSSRVLIAGGAGFLGSHLSDRLIKEGHSVLCVDNFLSGDHRNIEHLLKNPNFELLEHDINQPLPENLGQLHGIFHFASPASPNPNAPGSYINHPIETLMVNTLGTQRLLELATINKCQIVLASTSEVYGDPKVHPQTEDYWGNVSPNGIRSCYDEGKRAMEALAFAYFRSSGRTRIKVLRIFNTYGPRMRLDDGRFIPTLVDSVVTGKPFVRFGDGTATRSFCYVDDLIDAIFLTFQKDEAVGQVINIGNPQEFSVIEATKVVEEVSGKKINIQEQPPLPDDPGKRKPDITKAKKILNWQPKVSFQEGIARMIKSYE